jgi:hypothetical protein
MPKAAVDEHHGVVFSQDQIRLTWQLPRMQPEAEAAAM